jgi:hypothetical protein
MRWHRRLVAGTRTARRPDDQDLLPRLDLSAHAVHPCSCLLDREADPPSGETVRSSSAPSGVPETYDVR